MLIWILLLFIIGYGIAGFHGSLTAQVLSRVNIKKEGVKNSDASNAAIVLGWKYGLLVVFIDIFKGFAAVAGLLLESGSFPLNWPRHYYLWQEPVWFSAITSLSI